MPNEGTLIITTADKGGAVVMYTENYIKEVNCQLSDKSNYKTLQPDPTLQGNKMVSDTLGQFKNKNLLPKKTAEGLKVINPKTSEFYIIPKIHKENNPRRPVINSINCRTSEILCFIDHLLRPLVREIPSYIKDTSDFVNKINDFNVTENSFLVSIDVKALYKDIPNSEGIAAVKGKHNNYTKKTIATKVIATFLALSLTLSNFIFNSKFYLQIKGCAMGTICAPTYANIFLSEFEERYIYSLIKNKSSSYLHFIADIFMVWTKSENKLKSFINEINKKTFHKI